MSEKFAISRRGLLKTTAGVAAAASVPSFAAAAAKSADAAKTAEDTSPWIFQNPVQTPPEPWFRRANFF